MKYVFPALIEWTFDLEEVSANVYEVTATDGVGRRVQFKGTDPDLLLEEAKSTILTQSNAARGDVR